MNSLSWLLYGAEAIGNVRDLFCIGGALGAAGAVAAFCISPAFGDTLMSSLPREVVLSRPPVIRNKAAKVLGWCLAAILVGCVLPSKQTVMLIAASEVGETIIASDQAQAIGGEAGALAKDSIRVLRNFINDQLDEPEAK